MDPDPKGREVGSSVRVRDLRRPEGDDRTLLLGTGDGRNGCRDLGKSVRGPRVGVGLGRPRSPKSGITEGRRGGRETGRMWWFNIRKEFLIFTEGQRSPQRILNKSTVSSFSMSKIPCKNYMTV